MPLLGRNIPIFEVPFPFQSPITGVSLGKPQLRLTSETSQIKLPFESRLQMPLLGRNIPILEVSVSHSSRQ